jgi:hypothetical protein
MLSPVMGQTASREQAIDNERLATLVKAAGLSSHEQGWLKPAPDLAYPDSRTGAEADSNLISWGRG